jgi:exosome complex component RRP42
MFDDDWETSVYLYPHSGPATDSRPPITLLVITVGDNIIFDPAKEELAVADVALAVSVAEVKRGKQPINMDVDSGRELRLLSVRTVDPPSRLTPPGVPNTANPASFLSDSSVKPSAPKPSESQRVEGVWKPRLGGAKFAVLSTVIQKVLERGGIADEVLDGLDGVELA